MCLRQIFAALTGKGGNQARNNRNSVENNIGINHIDTPAVTATPSTKNNKPSLIARTDSEDLSSNSKGGNKNDDETSSDNESNKDKAKEKAEKEKWDRIRKSAERIRDENIARHGLGGSGICDGYSEKEKAEKEKWDRILKNSKRMGDENRARHGRGTSGNAPYNSIDIYEY